MSQNHTEYTCSDCGAEVFEGNGTCPKCGATLEWVTKKLEINDRISFPKVWIGFGFALLPFLLIMFAPTGPEYQIVHRYDPSAGRWIDISPMHPMLPYAYILVVLGWSYWLYCIHRIHRILSIAAKGAYPISARRAAWFHLIPVFNLWWVFEWTNQVVNFINENSNQAIVKHWIGLLLCVGIMLAYLSLTDPNAVLSHATGLGIAMIVVFYLGRKIRQTVVINPS